MSYAYEFSRRAIRQFQELDPWLAEELLDELESLLTRPPVRRDRSPAGVVHDFVRQRNNQHHYVFLTLLPITGRRVLRVTSIGVHVRKA